MTFASDMDAVAVELLDIAVFGNTATFSEPDETNDPASGKVTVNNAPTTTVTTIGGPIGVDPGLVDGTIVQSRDLLIWAAPSELSAVPAPARTTVTIDGDVFTVVQVTTYGANDANALHEMRIR